MGYKNSQGLVINKKTVQKDVRSFPFRAKYVFLVRFAFIFYLLNRVIELEEEMQVRILHRYHKANDWAAFTGSDAILKKGEIGIESDTGLCKIGDGNTTWNELKYCGARDEDQKYFFQSLAYVPRDSLANNLRGKLAYVYTGTFGKQTDRAFMYLNKTVDGVTTCELVPISYFAHIRDQAEIKQDEGT